MSSGCTELAYITGATYMNNKILKSQYSFNLLLPGLLVYFVFFILPCIIGLVYSFTNWDFTNADFIGIDNYVDILTNPSINKAIINTLIFTVVTTIFKTGFGLALAVLLNRNLKTTNFMRTIFFLPAVLSTVSVGIVFVALMHPETGMINVFLRHVGLDFLAQNWLTDPKFAMLSISFIEIWKWTGFMMVIFLAGLQAISVEYYEAAEIDGANKWERFKNITFPLLTATFNNVLVLCLIGGLKVFDIVYITTGGGPGQMTEVMNTMIYKSFTSNFQGRACAGYVILSLIVAIISITTYSQVRKREVQI